MTGRGAVLASAVRPGRPRTAPGGARSTTGPALRRLRTLILLGTAVALGTSWWAFTAVEHFERVVHEQAAPAAAQLSTARKELLNAEEIAFAGTDAATTSQFLGEISIASQLLARATRTTAGGDPSRQLLQSVQGQILDYFTLVTRAQQEAPTNPRLSGADLTDAYVELHGGSGILAGLDTLIAGEQRAVTDLGGSGGLDARAWPLWVLPLLGLGAVLVVAQLFLHHRLRRTTNPWLLLATAVLAVTAAYCAQRATHDLRARGPDRLVVTAAADREDHTDLLEPALKPTCGRDCGRTLPALAGRPAPSEHTLAAGMAQFTTPAAGSVAAVIPIAAVAIGILVWAGFLGPVSEYRFPLQ